MSLTTRAQSAPPGVRAAGGLTGAAGAIAAASLVGVMFMGSTLLTPLYALYRAQFGFSVIGLTLLYSVYVIGNLSALLFLGRLSDRIGRKRVALAALGLATISTLLFLAAPSAAWLFAGRILSGFAVGLGSGAGVAWIAESMGGKDRLTASIVATTANFLGLTVGPLLAGPLAEYAPWPLRLAYVAYLGVLVAVALGIFATRETVTPQGLAGFSFKPRVGVPESCRACFVAPAISIFAIMALVGFYAVVAPGIIKTELHQANVAVGAAIASEMFLASAIFIVVTRRVSSHTAMLAGLLLMPVALGLLVGTELARSMPLFAAAAAFGGLACALGFRGGLQLVNEIAPPDRRAELVSSYYLTGFVGNSLPVIGFGVVSTLAGAATASAVFAATLAFFALVAFAAGLRFRPSQPAAA